MEISKSAVLLANDIKATRRNFTNYFLLHCRYVVVHTKTTLSMECQRM